MGEKVRYWCYAALVVACVAAVCVPIAAHIQPFAPDSTEYLAVANSWVHGAGFVDPIQWFYSISDPPPLPGFAVRAPAISLLAAASFALGSSIEALVIQHALLAALVAGVLYLVAARFMRPGCALLAALVVTISPAWAFLGSMPLTEILAVLASCLVLAAAPGVSRSVPGALLCVGVTVVAWLTRANLLVLFPAVLLGNIWRLGWRTPRSVSWWTYLLAFPLAMLAISATVKAATGLAPYAGYASVTGILSQADARLYGQPSLEWLAFVQANWEEIVARIGVHVLQFGAMLLSVHFNALGWFILPGTLWALRPGSPNAPLRATCSLAAWGFAASVMLNYASFAPIRFPFLPFVLGGLCVFALFDDLASAVERRWSRSWTAAARVAVGVLFLVALLAGPVSMLRGLTHTLAASGPTLRELPPVASICSWLRPSGIVAAQRRFGDATPSAWTVHSWCGNPTIALPTNIAEPGILERFLEERDVAYVVVGGSVPWTEKALPAPRKQGAIQVFRVDRSPPRTEPVTSWTPPRPLMCASRRVVCEELDGVVLPTRTR